MTDENTDETDEKQETVRGLTVNFAPDDFDVVEDASWDHRMSKNELIRTAVDEFLQNSDEDDYPNIETQP